MTTVLFLPTAKVVGDQPSSWLKKRLDAGIKIYQEHPEYVFVVSGRWGNVTDSFELTESEVAKRYILSVVKDAEILIKT